MALEPGDMWNPTTTSGAAKTKKSSRDLLLNTLNAWAELYGKKLKPEAVEVWMGIFVSTESAILSAALQKLTETAERMPTPGQLTKAIIIVREGLGFQGQRGERQCTCKKCNGTGFELIATNQHYTMSEVYKFAKKCDCHPEHAQVRSEIEAVDPEGTPCWVDGRTGEYLYRASDCPEGREFLKMLSKVAGKIALVP